LLYIKPRFTTYSKAICYFCQEKGYF